MVTKARTASRWRTVALFVSPVIVLIVVLRLLPFGQAISSSLLSAPFGPLGPADFVGLGNYIEIFTQPSFQATIVRTLVFSLVINPLQIGCALLVALLVRQRLYGKSFWRLMVFIPTTIPLVGASIAAGVALRNDGPINALLGMVGIGPQAFFNSPQQALGSIILVASWIGIGYWMIFLISGLDEINGEVYEAARIDGAGRLRTFFSVTLPLLKRPLLFVLVADTVANFVLFVPIQVLTNGGPESSTTLLMFDIYRQTYQYSNPNLGAAQTVVLTALMLAIVAVQFRLMKEAD